MDVILGLLMRWIHVVSAMIALGGLIYARWVQGPEPAPDAVAARFRPWAIAALAGLLGSGFYNFFTKGVYPPGYHMWFGIKFLLALHVLAVVLLLGLPGRTAAKRQRMMSGAVVSGLILVAISGWLRWITLNAR